MNRHVLHTTKIEAGKHPTVTVEYEPDPARQRAAFALLMKPLKQPANAPEKRPKQGGESREHTL